MPSPLVLASWFLGLPDLVARIDDALSVAINQLVGHSKTFDILVSLPLQNDLLKAGVVGACFFAVWCGKGAPDPLRARRLLLTALIATVLAVGVTRTLSDIVFLPRPFVRTEKIYHLENDRLVEVRRLPYRVPLDGLSQQRFRALRSGEVRNADLGSFPSDHAGLFVTLSLGIWLASPAAGGLALAWTLLVILGSKLLAGMHTPIDVIAGSAIAVAVTALCHGLARSPIGALLDRAARWTMEHRALSSALAFVVMYEICNTLFYASALLRLVANRLGWGL